MGLDPGFVHTQKITGSVVFSQGKSRVVKKGDGPAGLPRTCLSLLKWLIKFKPKVVTAVLICDPLFSV